jgi:glycosyltransferase involved in cell wall biosynthesis
MFSVLIPVYNHRHYAADAVQSALASPLVREILVADDGSSDDSREVVARLALDRSGRVRDLTPAKGGNIGAHARLNQLAEAASQPWLAVLNSDDLFAPARFEAAQMAVNRTRYDFVTGYVALMDGDGAPLGIKRGPLSPEFPFPGSLKVRDHLKRRDLLPLLANQNFIATTSNMMFTKKLYQKIGGFRDYRYVHDWDFALRAALLGKPLFLPQILARYRTHATNTIKEDGSRVTAEVRRLFKTMTQDFAAAFDAADVAAALAGNRYLLDEAA